ncbi:CarD family transcriptional regulator [Bradyrhizobium canariense]|nr:CarD family transcriptional regulator [Bradyrhizobium canariense]OSI22667.1 CarD family transcriptional regulator [Bradyrhizobium canariense]OSI28284.1 CarD family transcriptional regulator [Bradyrhizobium canariense]OSI47114.1 CarD family transcriptional regulator [Bradyrhizobium canariense]OSI49350.1 CarD family transcriptional regulator [Bradyrhizobium canariense]OSI57121.1 CarD family transcriptional regulator [Bradyrhizobium canariense]
MKPNVEQGRGSFRAQAVSQKTRKKSTSAKASHKDAKKVAAASRSASKGRTATKAPAAKSSKNKRSAMPNKTAKPAAKATVAKPVAAKPAAKPAVAKAPAAKPAAKAPVAAAPAKAPVAAAKPAVKPAAVAPKVEEKKVVTQRQGFKANEFVVYPAHGVGQILAIEEQEIAGAKLELFVINFIKDKMTLRVPTAKVANVGMRKLSDPALVKRALETLKGRARVKRTMWSRRAQEYEAKINSGDIVAIAEVVRDLYRSESQPEQSYSERQLYEAALDRLSREIAVVQHSTETEAVKEIEAQLAKSPRRTGAKSEAAEGEADADAEGDSDETEGGATVADEAA